jgi:hypothetical protein
MNDRAAAQKWLRLKAQQRVLGDGGGHGETQRVVPGNLIRSRLEICNHVNRARRWGMLCSAPLLDLHTNRGSAEQTSDLQRRARHGHRAGYFTQRFCSSSTAAQQDILAVSRRLRLGYVSGQKKLVYCWVWSAKTASHPHSASALAKSCLVVRD